MREDDAARAQEPLTKLHYTSLAEHAALLRQGLPILCYHKIGTRPRAVKWRSLYVSTALFRRQMSELAAAGFTTASLSEELPTPGANEQRKVALTFDDAYANVLTNAASILAAHRMRATLFIVSGAIGGINHWDVREAGEVPERLMNQAEIREWLAQGHAIGSHSVSHPRLTQLSPAQQREELMVSKRMLEDTFGVPVEHFCYPYGDTSEELQELVAACGYRTACTQYGGVNHAQTPRWALRRLEVRYAKRSPRAVLRRLWLRLVGRG